MGCEQNPELENCCGTRYKNNKRRSYFNLWRFSLEKNCCKISSTELDFEYTSCCILIKYSENERVFLASISAVRNDENGGCYNGC